MAEIKVTFLGKEYCFPKEIQQYVYYCNKFQKISDDFMTVIGKRIKDRWYDYPDKEFEELFRKAGKEVIGYLSHDRIYDVTINELIEQNKGYISFQSITKEGFEKYKSISVEALEEYIKGYENAQAIANSKVTGSGMTLYSSSLLAHMTFAVLESNTVKKQMSQADKEYRKTMSELSKQNQTTQEKNENNFLYNELYPAYLNIIGIFISEIIEKYLQILCERAVFDYSKVKEYDEQKSTELLENLDILDDKKEVLIAAFINCPYNTIIYQKVVELGLMDADTFRTMQIFCQDENAIDYLQSYCVKNSNNMEILERYVPILAVAKNVNEKKIWYALFGNNINNIVQWYQELNSVLNSNENLDIWIYDNICKNTEELLELDKNEIVRRVSTQLKNHSMIGLSLYINKGIVSLDEIRLKGSNAESIEVINVEYCTVCVDKIEKLIHDLKEKKEEEKQKQHLIEIEHKKKKKRIMAIIFGAIASISMVVVLVVLVITYLPADKRFGMALEKCLVNQDKLRDLNTVSDYQKMIRLEEEVMSYEGKGFKDKEIEENYNLYISGVKDQIEALENYDTDESKCSSLWASGFMKRSEAIVNLQAIGAIHLDKDLYGYYAAETLRNHIGRLVDGAVTFRAGEDYQYYLPVTVDNCTLAYFENVTITAWWNSEGNDIYMDSWDVGEVKNIKIPVPDSIINDLSQPIHFTVEFINYDVESLAEY
ncbi:hypothetical protein ACTM97_09000 [Oliverpabstia intestinalis]|uniref:hypothetical protein n=1 Tax=Oliverpabstia intestinalis TaxID=2606633 RepID=UPI003F88E404